MNKINVGTLAVSRYHQIRRLFLVDDSPNYDDHDFPTPGYKIETSGYLRLTAPPSVDRDHHAWSDSECDQGHVKRLAPVKSAVRASVTSFDDMCVD